MKDGWLKDLIDSIEREEKVIKQGGGSKRIEKEHKKGKLTARERIDLLLDEDSAFEEIGLWAAYKMYKDEGGCPSAGVVTGIGSVEGKKCMIVANDATVKAGAWFPMTAKKNLRPRKLPSKITYRLYTLLIQRECICRCRMKFFLIKNILEEYSEIML